MRVGIRTIAGIAFSATCLLPMAALAITDDPVEEVVAEEPVVEEPVVEEPVVEEPVVVVREKSDAEKPIKNTEKQPVVKTKKTVVTTKRTQPEVKVYSYKTKANFCGAGLQPVTISGVVSCGRPNQSRTYQQMMAHPTAVVKRKKVRHVTQHRSARPTATCQPGLKGCSDR